MTHNSEAKIEKKLLIIHAGADKCASSSLQQSLGALNKNHPHLQDYYFLKNNSLIKRNDSEAENKLSVIKKIFKERSSDTIIVSNEGLIGESLPSLPLLCKTALEDYCFDQVLIAMYSRSPASHAVSSYHQWFFRNKEILIKDIKITESLGLNSDLLTPLERRLTAIISRRQQRNWHQVIQKIKNETINFGDKIQILSSHIPTKENSYQLLTHFLESAAIAERYKNIPLSKFNRRSNDRFSEELTHAISIILCADNYSGSFTPGPHELNHFLSALSLVLSKGKNNFKENMNEAYENFQKTLDALSFSLNELAREGTLKYCEEFCLQPDPFFHPTTKNHTPIIELIKKVSESRNSSSIREYNEDCIERVSQAHKKLSSHVPWMKVARQLL